MMFAFYAGVFLCFLVAAPGTAYWVLRLSANPQSMEALVNVSIWGSLLFVVLFLLCFVREEEK